MTEQTSRGTAIDGHRFASTAPCTSHSYLMPTLMDVLSRVHPDRTEEVFDLGCGNGAMMQRLDAEGYVTRGVDPSREGVERARQVLGDRVETGSAYDDLAARYGRFRSVYSFEVVEHVYAPRAYAATVADLLHPGGHAVISTPYHGYLKNLAMAVTNRMDGHFTALWDHGHIKFWSIATLTTLMAEAGLERVEVHRVGRIPPLAKSMILVFRKPA